jgi:hypothetical protein
MDGLFLFASIDMSGGVSDGTPPATPLRLTSLRQIASSETGCVHTQPRTAGVSPVGAILHCDLSRSAARRGSLPLLRGAPSRVSSQSHLFPKR